MSNRLVLNETSYHGKGAIQEIAGEVKRRGFKKAFVCSGPTIFKHGVTKKVTDVLDQAGCAYEVYTNIKENPTIENVQNGVEEYKKSGADFIIAIGGGSPMDTAKAIGIIINDPDEVNADLDRIYEHMEEKLMVYFGLTEEQARSLSSMSEEEILLLLEEARDE